MRTRGCSLLVCALLLAAAPARHDEFALSLFRQLRSHAGNMVLSPANVVDALTLIERAAGGKTRHELDEAMRGALPARGPGFVSLSALWAESIRLRPSYAAAVRELGGSVKAISFADRASAAARINAWGNAATKGTITHIVDAESVDSKTRVAITSAVYMKAKWRSQFDDNDTHPRAFYLSDRSEIRVPTMEQTLRARYAALDQVQLIELPYETDGLTMLIVLPNSSVELPSVETVLTPALLARWTSALDFRDRIELTLPRFHTTSSFELRKSLRGLGIVDLFDRNGASLPGIISSQPLYVSSFLNKVWVTVDEVGTEASALSYEGEVGGLGIAPAEPPIPFHVDHPFLYLIRSGDQILFFGRMTDPL
jgi:serpin B